MARLTLSLLGPLQVRLDDQPLSGLAYAKIRALLAYLAVEARPHGRDALAEFLWPGQTTAAARRSLRVALTTLRQAIGDPTAPIPFLIGTRESVQINPASAVALDVTTFTDLLCACQPHFHPMSALCPDSVAFDEWVTLLRERLHRSALEALAALAAYHEGCGADDLARQYAWRQLALEGWDEAAHCCVMRVLARRGQRSAALAQYERCRRVLADELGVEPSAETTALYEQLRTRTLARMVAGAAVRTPSGGPHEDQTSGSSNGYDNIRRDDEPRGFVAGQSRAPGTARGDRAAEAAHAAGA